MPQHCRPILLCHTAQCDGKELDSVLGHMHAEEGVGAKKANDRQTHGTKQCLYGQMDKWRGKGWSVCQEMQKQMAAFILRLWEREVMVQLETQRASQTGWVAFWHESMGCKEGGGEEQRSGSADKIITWSPFIGAVGNNLNATAKTAGVSTVSHQFWFYSIIMNYL